MKQIESFRDDFDWNKLNNAFDIVVKAVNDLEKELKKRDVEINKLRKDNTGLKQQVTFLETRLPTILKKLSLKNIKFGVTDERSVDIRTLFTDSDGTLKYKDDNKNVHPII